MVESNPFDEDVDKLDPYSTALNSDEEAGQLRTVSQEDDLAEVDEETPRSISPPQWGTSHTASHNWLCAPW
jgi:hypothetical protein